MDITDPNLKDTFGNNAEVGVDVTIEDRLSFDVSYFQIQYNNRIRSLTLPDQNGQNYVYKTNIGNFNEWT